MSWFLCNTVNSCNNTLSVWILKSFNTKLQIFEHFSTLINTLIFHVKWLINCSLAQEAVVSKFENDNIWPWHHNATSISLPHPSHKGDACLHYCAMKSFKRNKQRKLWACGGFCFRRLRNNDLANRSWFSHDFSNYFHMSVAMCYCTRQLASQKTRCKSKTAFSFI